MGMGFLWVAKLQPGPVPGLPVPAYLVGFANLCSSLGMVPSPQCWDDSRTHVLPFLEDQDVDMNMDDSSKSQHHYGLSSTSPSPQSQHSYGINSSSGDSHMDVLLSPEVQDQAPDPLSHCAEAVRLHCTHAQIKTIYGQEVQLQEVIDEIN